MLEGDDYDFYKVCRACLTNAPDMKSLHVDYTTEICVADVFQSVTSLKFSSEQNDEPINICGDCFRALSEAYMFVQKCRESDKKIQIYRDKIAKPNAAKHINAPIFLKVFEEFTNETHIRELEQDNTDLRSEHSYDSSKTLFREILIDQHVDLVDEKRTKVLNPVVVIKRLSDDQVRSLRKKQTVKNRIYKLNNEKTCTSDSNSLVCQICNGKYESKRNLIKHMRTIHIGVKPFSCLVCDMAFLKKADIVEHMLIHTREKPYSCSICNKTFKHKTSYKNHMRIHTGEKPYSCTVCAKSFIQRVHLIQHQSMHSEEKPYACTYCDKTYKRNTSLIRHVVQHTGGNSYSCTVCGDTFRKKEYLMTHMLKHNGGKLYSCTTCTKAFSQKVHLTLHERTHSGEKPHSCTVCQKEFAQLANLNRHLRTHTEVKPFSCATCDWSFREKPNLATHMQTHQGTNLFHCTVCNSPFKFNSSLTRHMSTHMTIRRTIKM